MCQRLATIALMAMCATSVGCPDSAPATWSVGVDQVRAEPVPPTTETPVVVTFRVTCRRTGGSGNKPVQVVTEVSRTGTPGVITERAFCSVGGSGGGPGVFVGDGRVDLGKLPPGKHTIRITLPPGGAGWTMPPEQTIEVVVVPAST